MRVVKAVLRRARHDPICRASAGLATMVWAVVVVKYVGIWFEVW